MPKGIYIRTKQISEKTRERIRIASTGRHHSEETRKKISESHKGKPVSEETRKKLSLALRGEKNPNFGKTGEGTPMFGKTHSEETRKKISESNKHKIISEETRKKISESHKGKIVSEKTREKLRITSSGKHHSEKTKEKIRITNLKVQNQPEVKAKKSAAMTGTKNPMFGRAGESAPMFGKTGENAPMFGKHHSKETRNKMRISHTGKHHSKETCEKISSSQIGKIISEEQCKQISLSRIGKPLSKNHRINISMGLQNISNITDWNGFIKETPYCKLFSPEFKIRQYEITDYTCLLCNKKISNPNCHHVYEQKASCCQNIDETGDLFFMIRNQKFYPVILPMPDTEKELEYGLNKFATLCTTCHGKVKGNKKSKSVFEYIRELEQIINNKYKGRSYYTREEYWGNGYYYNHNEKEIYYDAITGNIYGKTLRGYQGWGLPKI